MSTSSERKRCVEVQVWQKIRVEISCEFVESKSRKPGVEWRRSSSVEAWSPNSER
jgi:hypothetical protein